MIGFHLPELIFLVFLASMLLVPWIIGFAWIVPDANRRGQPGWMWGVGGALPGLDRRSCLSRRARIPVTKAEAWPGRGACIGAHGRAGEKRLVKMPASSPRCVIRFSTRS